MVRTLALVTALIGFGFIGFGSDHGDVALKIGTKHVEGDAVALKIGTKHVEGDAVALKIGTKHVEGDAVALKIGTKHVEFAV